MVRTRLHMKSRKDSESDNQFFRNMDASLSVIKKIRHSSPCTPKSKFITRDMAKEFMKQDFENMKRVRRGEIPSYKQRFRNTIIRIPRALVEEKENEASQTNKNPKIILKLKLKNNKTSSNPVRVRRKTTPRVSTAPKTKKSFMTRMLELYNMKK